ncbi:hypothetical protein GCM10023258_34230 [Terrabacter aeriphilus]|uniref:Uncharacterized protein n=1 Tax=Terrabacter aeriphilus TaxID=515662 RepID=A0ABP9JMD1_9MICO
MKRKDAPHQPTAWMRERLSDIEARARAIRQAHSEPDGRIDTLFMPLYRMGAFGSTEEYMCDHCRAYVPERLIPVMLVPLPRLVVTGGLCPACAALEGIPAEKGEPR